MFTINLKEVELTPRISEDKLFSNEHKYEVEREASDYILEKYSDLYKNPLTVRRKLREVVRDDNNETFDEKFEREQKEWNEVYEKQRQVEQGIREEIKKKYEPEFEKLAEGKELKLDNLGLKYDERLNTLSKSGDDEEYKKVKEEMEIERDDIRYEYIQQKEALTNKRYAEIDEKIKEVLGDN